MAVSGKTKGFEIPYLEESDIPDMGAGDKAIAERVNEVLESVSGPLGVHLYHAAEVSRTAEVLGSFSIPLKVTLPEIKGGQIIEIVVSTQAKRPSSPAGVHNLTLALNGTALSTIGLTQSIEWDLITTRSDSKVPLGASAAAAELTSLKDGPLNPLAEPSGGANGGVARFLVGADHTNYTVELVSGGSGTLTLAQTYLLARVVG